MKLAPRDRRALSFFAVFAAGAILYSVWPESDSGVVSAEIDSIPQAERRLVRLRQLAGSVPARQQSLQKAAAELAGREKGLIQADTANQAQARLVEIVRRTASQQAIELRSVDLGQPKPFGATYGEVSVTITFHARIEQLVNLLAELGAQPELIASSEMQLNAVSGKQKTGTSRLSITALVPRKLIPEKKGLAF